MTLRIVAEWLALLLCTVSFVAYLCYSMAVAKYVQLYVLLLSKFARLLAG
jgi:hypothetical protein